jgi:FtsP/CotA-like multicopper oxidase with cupredoxin domain
MNTLRAFLVVFLACVVHGAQAKVVRYELTIKNERVNLSGQKEVDFALTVNGGIPAPTLEFTEGDDAEILVTNGIEEDEVSLHWHGILLPPEEDGVAYVNTPPIFPGKSRLFKFKIRQHGTYWYHSHTHLQEQKGVYGAFVIHPKKPTIAADKEAVLVLSDWSDENADQVLRNLRKDGDYYLYKKDSVRSYYGALKAGGLGTYLSNEWTRMGGMDLSDVGYDAFLINGKRDAQLLVAHPGERVRLRIINAGASSYFYVSMGVPMQVISADGVDVEPIMANELLMGMAETYDVLFTVPEHKNYEIRATAQDVTGHASAWIGMGEKLPAPDKAKPDAYAPMNHGAGHGGHAGHEGHQGHQGHQGHPAATETLTVEGLTALSSTELPLDAKVHELKLVLGGDMERYVWHINGKAIQEDRLLLIDEGEIVRFTFVNETMMHHPMHLHGHFFRVLNDKGALSPLKHTVDVPPHGTRTIEFYANEPGQWMLHCHNLYHMKTGMARIVRYKDFQLTPGMKQHEGHDPHLHEHLYTHTQLEAATNHAKADFRLLRTWDELDLGLESSSESARHFRVEGPWEHEGEVFYRRWVSNYLNFFGGASLVGEEVLGTAGLSYLLPLLIESSVSVNHEGRFQIDLEKHFQWTSTIFSDAKLTWRPEWPEARSLEFDLSLMYGPQWSWAVGLMATQDRLGFGAQLQF